jgi:hypothetical protein
MSYELHPSEELRAHFQGKPWQGSDPVKALFLFIGLDANYKNIRDKEMLQELLDYHNDGVAYWQTKRFHHPFMLPHYHGDGKRYHCKFAEIGFTPEDAELVSFVELLHLPTTAISHLKLSDLSTDHLRFLAKIFDCGSARYIFLPPGVTRLMRQTREFTWLPKIPLRSDDDLSVLREQNGQTVYEIYHLSCHYNKQLSKLKKQIAQVREIVRTYKRTNQ